MGYIQQKSGVSNENLGGHQWKSLGLQEKSGVYKAEDAQLGKWAVSIGQRPSISWNGRFL